MAADAQHDLENEFRSTCQDMCLDHDLENEFRSIRQDMCLDPVEQHGDRANVKNVICEACGVAIMGQVCYQDGDNPKHFGCIDISRNYRHTGQLPPYNRTMEERNVKADIVNATRACTGEGQPCRVPMLVVLSALLTFGCVFVLVWKHPNKHPSAASTSQMVRFYGGVFWTMMHCCEMVARCTWFAMLVWSRSLSRCKRTVSLACKLLIYWCACDFAIYGLICLALIAPWRFVSPWLWRSFIMSYGGSYFIAATPDNDADVVAFHGTSRQSALGIARGGFYASQSGMLGQGVYVTRDLKKARVYASSVQGGVIVVVRIRLGNIAHIDHQCHRIQYTWQGEFDSAFVPAMCGMVPSGREEACVADPSRIDVIGFLNVPPFRCISLRGLIRYLGRACPADYWIVAWMGVREGILDLLCVMCLIFLLATLYKLPQLIRIATARSMTRRLFFDSFVEVLTDASACLQHMFGRLTRRVSSGRSIAENHATPALLGI